MPIPKLIHYCWFGGNPMTELATKCMESWKKFCPDYEIIRWDETNFDLNYCSYVREAMDSHQWAFVSDVLRLYVLKNYGGVYMDTDVEVLKPLDELLCYEAFSGFQQKREINTGMMASEPGQEMICELLSDYDDLHFIKEDGTFDLTTNVVRITRIFLKYGLRLDNSRQTIKGFTLFPMEYFCPFDMSTRRMNITKDTYTVHHFAGSWLPEEGRYAKEMRVKLDQYLPPNLSNHFAMFAAECKYHGIGYAIKSAFQWMQGRRDR